MGHTLSDKFCTVFLGVIRENSHWDLQKISEQLNFETHSDKGKQKGIQTVLLCYSYDRGVP